MKTVTPTEARALLEQGALLVDIRSPDEHAREHIPGACCIPLGELASALALAQAHLQRPVVFHCRSGMRTRGNLPALGMAAGGCPAYVLDGGLDAWKQAGLPVAREAGAPLELMRQVQLGAGGLVLLGTLLAATVSPWFLLLTGFVGGGLLLAGATGFCGMAHLLGHMPWNRALRS